MASSAFTLGKETLSFELGRKVTKEDLYGKLRKLVVKGGEVLERGYLAQDGRPDEKTDAEILESHVYRNGKDSVRKFVLAKSGGDTALPCIFIYTDFSADRKEPLKVSTEYAYTEERTQSLLKASRAENAKPVGKNNKKNITKRESYE
jgi:hypothetical protein